MPARVRHHRLSVVADNTAAHDRDAAQHAPASVRAIDWSILMARAQTGDAAAYRLLLEEIVPYLRARLARRYRDRRDVEDTVQDVLLTLHTIRHAYDPSRPFAPWLVAIANRRVVDRLRRQGRNRRGEAALAAEQETFEQGGANSEEAGSREEALRRAVASLPPGQRRAVTLLKFEEMPLKQAAEASGVSIAALKVAMHRALKNLRRILAGSGGKP